MKTDWKNWSQLWQQQNAPDLSPNEIIERLNRLGTSARRQRRWLVLTFSITAITLLSMGLIWGGIWTSAGIGLMLFAMGMILYQAFSSPLQVVDEIAQFDQQQFLKRQIKALEQGRRLASRYMWIYAVLLTLGLNLTYLDALSALYTSWRIAISLVVSLTLLSAFAYSISRYLSRLDQELGPLVNQLKAWQSN
ncbi:MAG: hypothetical protein AAF433_20930 [Bacteroidota bacterium]